MAEDTGCPCGPAVSHWMNEVDKFFDQKTIDETPINLISLFAME